MSKKCVIEIWPTTQRVVTLGVDLDGRVVTHTVYVDDLEELNSDYINEHFGDLQDTAYQRGLDDAWAAARKIVRMPEGDLLNIFTECYSSVCTALQVLLKYDASEAIEKLKAYEEKQQTDGHFEFGDEIIDSNGVKGCVISKDNEESNTMYALFDKYRTPQCITQRNYRKTGKHYDIFKILKEMQS